MRSDGVVSRRITDASTSNPRGPARYCPINQISLFKETMAGRMEPVEVACAVLDECARSAIYEDDLMAEKKSDSKGTLHLRGHENELTTVDPKLNIYHNCNDERKVKHFPVFTY
ncbi:unnamed protein product [Anisakis simplex]|uniref:Uncharacterized protein n=1 Tax=Anisakis simplex TaxID=6269 RepID=A0A0M3J2Y5_ANISI|nr:unnamed protein product [Anisakis simplex]